MRNECCMKQFLFVFRCYLSFSSDTHFGSNLNPHQVDVNMMICDLISHLPIIAPYTDLTWLSSPSSPLLNITALFSLLHDLIMLHCTETWECNYWQESGVILTKKHVCENEARTHFIYFKFQYYLKFYKVFESQVWERHKIFTTCKRFLVWYILTILCPTK